MFRTGAVTEEYMKATCTVLARMAELYRKLDVVGVRAVATSAIRDTRNQREFLARASEAAGAPVEIISGREEARLIHLGVESNWPQQDKRVLIIDIGGGSAEIIASDRGRLIEAYSKPLGAVRLRESFSQGRPAGRPAVAPDAGVHPGEAGYGGAAARTFRLGPRDRDVGDRLGGGQRGGAGAALEARRGGPAARFDGAGPQGSTRRFRCWNWRRDAR